MTPDFKALREELSYLDGREPERYSEAAREALWLRSNRDALLSALELAQQVERIKCELVVKEAELQLPKNQQVREIQRLEAENASLKSQVAEAEKLNETWSLAYERAQQQLAAKERGKKWPK